MLQKVCIFASFEILHFSIFDISGRSVVLTVGICAIDVRVAVSLGFCGQNVYWQWHLSVKRNRFNFLSVDCNSLTRGIFAFNMLLEFVE